MIIKTQSKTTALVKAQQIFNCPEKDIMLTTIKCPCKKFFGLIKIKGIYEAKQIKKKEAASDENRKIDINGSVEIKDGAIIVKNPLERGRYASIITEDPNIEIYVNNSKVSRIAVLSETDDIKVYPRSIKPKIEITAEISDDKLKTFLTVSMQPGKQYYISDAEKSISIKINSMYKKIAPPEITIEDCVKEILETGTKFKFIHFESIRKLISQQEGGTVVAAEGIPAVQEMKSLYKYYFDISSPSRKDFKNLSHMDYFDKEPAPTVQIGDVLAEKAEGSSEERGGITVTGEIIEAKTAKDNELEIGYGVSVIDNGSKIVATIGGRPILRNNKISVMPLLIIPNDVGADSGDIKFEGDIVIKGNVLDNANIETYGDIKVYGSIFNASITSSSNVQVFGNVVGSNVTAGSNIMNYFCAIPKMEQIEKIIKKYMECINSDNINLLSVVNIESRVLSKCIKEIEGLFKSMKENEVCSLKNLIDKIELTLVGLGAKCLEDNNLIRSLYDEIVDYTDNIKCMYMEKADIVIKNCQNSTLQACGNIIVLGEGSYQTNLIAKNSILFNKPSSSVKGGILVAGKYIKAGTVGTQAGIHTYCRIISKYGKIRARLLIGTIVNINNTIKEIVSDDDSKLRAICK